MYKYIKPIWKAWRPFSLTAAVIPTTLGCSSAFLDDIFNVWKFILLTIGGLLIQSGVNLINDFFEFKSGILPEKNPELKVTFKKRLFLEYVIFFMGLGCFGLTVPIGLYLVYNSGIWLLIIGIVGFIGGYTYTGKPFSYKDKALGVVFVFFLMGVFMVVGSYYSFNASFSMQSILISLPISFLVSLLLISNEIRDIEIDTKNELRTLSVVIGAHKAKILYFWVMTLPYCLVLVFCILKIAPWLTMLVLLSYPYGYKIYKMLDLKLPERRLIVPKTANLHFMFGILLIFGLTIEKILSIIYKFSS